MKKVSVIIPVYNVENYLEKCLDSLVNQTLKEIEIIVVNDGSSDNSQKIIDKYVKKYPNQVISINQENGGQGAARNTGISYASGEYIGYVDSDDYVEKNMYEEMYNKAKSENADIVICGNNIVSEDNELLGQNDADIQFLLGQMAVWNKIYRRELIIKNKIEFRSKVWYEDLDFTMKVYFLSKKISYVNKYLYNYLLRNGSTMNNNNLERNLEIIQSIDSLLNFCKNKKIYKKNVEEIEFISVYHAYIFAICRVLNTKNTMKSKKNVINQLTDYVKHNFPNFKKNRYLKILPFKRKLLYHLINFRLYIIIIMMFKFK